MIYSADFETTTQENDCRVWAWGICDIKSFAFQYGNSMETFIEFLKKHGGDKFYFHNLKFDSEFIIYWLFKNNFIYIEDARKLKSNSFNVVLSDMGNFYSMKICFYKDNDVENIVEIVDSLKLFNFKVEELSKKFGLDDKKLKINYDEYREVGHELTSEEIAYLKNDVIIVAKCLNIMFDMKLNKNTIASNALNSYKKLITPKKFNRWFPKLSLEDDSNIRESYKGGFTYVNPKIANKNVGDGIVLDVNSLYPFVMSSKKLPYDYPIRFEGEYQKDDVYNIYIQVFRCNFKLKENYIPTIQIKNDKAFKATEYLETDDSNYPVLCLTNIDLKLFKEHYIIENIEYLFGYKFKSTSGLFDKYINHWMDVKVQGQKEGKEGMRQCAKLMLNALYGKFGLNPVMVAKTPYLEDDIVRYQTQKEKIREPIYIPMASFITAYAREITIRSAQKNFDRFLYSDTDSLHLSGTDIPDNIKVDNYELGAWKHESTFSRARFIRAKTYIETINGKDVVTGAGMPDECKSYVTWKNFKPNTKIKKGKLAPKHVPGGIVLKDIDFTIKI